MSLHDPRNVHRGDGAIPSAGKAFRRRSVMNQVAEPSITDTATFTAKAIADTGAFRLSLDDESVTAVEIESIDPGQKWYQPLGDLSDEFADSAVMLLLPKDILAQELEALAVSRFADAMWSAPGQLRIHRKAYLHGPFHVSSQMNEKMHTRKLMHWAYIFECPRTREGQLPEELRGLNFFDDVFSDNVPGGLERTALEALVDFATRLRGQIVVHHGGKYHRHTPDPDSYVNLRVYSPQFLYPQIALELLSVVMPSIEVVADSTGTIEAPDDASNASFDASGAPSYVLQADAGFGCHFSIHAQHEHYVQPALRWETWVDSDFYVYDIEWHYIDDQALWNERIPRKLRIQRAQASRVIEQAAVALAVLTHGVILDEGGFIVGYDRGE